MTMNSFKKKILYGIKKIHAHMFHEKILLENRKKINQDFSKGNDI